MCNSVTLALVLGVCAIGNYGIDLRSIALWNEAWSIWNQSASTIVSSRANCIVSNRVIRGQVLIGWKSDRGRLDEIFGWPSTVSQRDFDVYVPIQLVVSSILGFLDQCKATKSFSRSQQNEQQWKKGWKNNWSPHCIIMYTNSVAEQW